MLGTVLNKFETLKMSSGHHSKVLFHRSWLTADVKGELSQKEKL